MDVVIDDKNREELSNKIKGLLESGDIQFSGDLKDGEMILTILAKDLKKNVNDKVTDPLGKSYAFGENCVWCNRPVAMTLFTHDKVLSAKEKKANIAIICPECALKVLTPKNITFNNMLHE
jgi:hypothetical protein